jgi:glycosyltransferase involved in cell wall biosynthesis
MPNVLRQATVVCLPSYREGMPRSLLEAAAMERAIVTTDVPGCRDAVDRGRAGLLVPARDAVALAAALREVLTNHTRRHALAASALRHARANFSETGVLQQHLALYESLLVK